MTTIPIPRRLASGRRLLLRLGRLATWSGFAHVLTWTFSSSAAASFTRHSVPIETPHKSLKTLIVGTRHSTHLLISFRLGESHRHPKGSCLDFLGGRNFFTSRVKTRRNARYRSQRFSRECADFPLPPLLPFSLPVSLCF